MSYLKSALIAAALLLCASVSVSAQEAVATPTATAGLAAPTDLVVFDNGAQWQDNSTGEDGYRAVITIGEETRTFELPSDSIRLLLPADFQATCAIPGRSIVEARVFAVLGTQEGPAASGQSSILCPPRLSTPTATAQATPTRAAPSLPPTGTGDGGGGPWPAAASVVLLVTLVAGAGVVWAGRRSE